jgi:hypothetical protein
MNEQTISEDQVRAEHLREVNVPAHWAYLATVLFGGLALMLAFLAFLGGAS